jgi:hypothetical protein
MPSHLLGSQSAIANVCYRVDSGVRKSIANVCYRVDSGVRKSIAFRAEIR